MKTLIAFCLLFAALLSGCAMPTEGCYSTNPLTNNPHVIHQRSDSTIPGLNL